MNFCYHITEQTFSVTSFTFHFFSSLFTTKMAYVHHPKKLSQCTKNLAAVATGRMPADLLIRNGKLVNVNVGYIQQNIDVAVKDGFIAYVGSHADHIQVDDHTKIIDANGRYLVPGFIDSHMHIESSMVDPRSFAAGVLPNGVTTICPDNHEITNVFGLKAVELFHKCAEGLPIKFLLAMPVCVPSIPGFEDAGAEIFAEDVSKAYREGWAQLQGEQMNFPSLLYGDDLVHSITAASLDANVCVTGHYPSNEIERGLNAFAACGMNACHEVTTAEGTLRRAELGIYPQMRYGTAWLDMPNCVKAYTENPGIDTRNFVLVTDDVTPATVVNDGQLLRVVRTAIQCGVPPVKAIQFVTINAAQLLEKSRWIGSISPSRAADILIVSDLAGMVIDEVYSDGVLVGKDGKLTVEFEKYEYPEWAINSVHLNPLSNSDFQIKVPESAKDKETVKVRIMHMYPGAVHTVEVINDVKVENGEIRADVDKDIAKIFMFYRHEKEQCKGTRGHGLVSGVKIHANCAYASTVSHDCHNLLVVGTSDEAMKVAANALIQCHGGICIVVDNKVESLMPMTLAGLMSLEGLEVAAKQIEDIERALAKAGCPYDNFEMTLSLLGLICIPDLHISNKGLVRLVGDKPPEIVDLIVEA
ncbi:AdeC [Tritrichomonas foetus]|uniref:adenine deaminase n=1 Tax=Tritrichomonas foetus TaxID=1144522 RepID=A0A1J4K430_9EUKA|nr:AdeC [Tritrichomonas foetus]|eukprot:OHT06209.1 AdeC [Tritrichomonas foetus]